MSKLDIRSSSHRLRRRCALAVAVPMLMAQMSAAFAEEVVAPEVDLGTQKVVIKTPSKQGVDVVSDEKIKTQLISDSKDLVRYNTEVDVADVGRYGNKGFAVRGVDGNRVAMNVDGVALPEVETNEIFSPYGYMYEGRFNPDLEVMRGVRVTAGADSLNSGSGAVGGAVSYMTKEPSDLIRGDQNFGGYVKAGYQNKNEQTTLASGIAYQDERFEVLINHAHNKGHETKNHAMRGADNNRLRPDYLFDAHEMPVENNTHSLIYPAPMEFTRDTTLAKLYYNFNDAHRLGVHGLYQKQQNEVNTEVFSSFGGRTSGNTRRAHDVEKLKNYGVNYTYTPQATAIDKLSLDYTRSEVTGIADTWLYDRTLACSDPEDSSYGCWKTGYNSSNTAKTATLDSREYRPTKTKTDQFTAQLKAAPIELGGATHTLDAKAGFVQSDRSTSATVLYEDSSKNFLQHAFADSKKKNFHLSLVNRMEFGDRLQAALGVRYDHFKYTPYFQNDVNGFSEDKRNYDTCVKNNAESGFCDAYRAGKSFEKTKFSRTTYSGMLNYEVIPDKLTARYQIGTGFLAPTATQIYRNFSGLGVLEVPNYQLKPETSLNQELTVKYQPTDNVTLTLSGYQSDYDDFIHTRFWEGKTGGCTGRAICLQSVNLDEARVRGVKVGVDANVSDHFNLDGTLNLLANFHTAKDSATYTTDNGEKLKINTLAATPRMLMFGADYVSPNEDWLLHSRLRFISRKKAQDTKSVETQGVYDIVTKVCPSYLSDYGSYACWSEGYTERNDKGEHTKTERGLVGYNEYVDTYKHADKSKSVAVWDIYGSKKFGANKQFTLNAGVYNITNVKYIPWESLRMFSNANVNNMVDKQGFGFDRYTAVGRNFAISATYEF